MTLAGFRIYYGDGSVVSGPLTFEAWASAPSRDVTAVNAFYAETYRIWQEGQWRTENYRTLYAICDYYSFDGREFSCGNAMDMTVGLDGSVKTGGLLSNEDFSRIYNAAHADVNL